MEEESNTEADDDVYEDGEEIDDIDDDNDDY